MELILTAAALVLVAQAAVVVNAFWSSKHPVVSAAFACCLLASSMSMRADAGPLNGSKKVSSIEYLYAEVSDANTILATIDSSLRSSYLGKDRTAWAHFRFTA